MAKYLGSRWFWYGLALVTLCALPLDTQFIVEDWQISPYMKRIFIFGVLALGLNIVSGFTGLLHLGIAAFMAIGAYTYAILTVGVYPFQLGFWPALFLAILASALAGALLGMPTLRLRGDYLAIVTMGFGEIMRDVLKNLEPITKGTKSLNPLPKPSFGAFEFGEIGIYYLFLAMIVACVVLCKNLERSKIGRLWVAIREDELAAGCMGINTARAKLWSMAVGAGFAGLAGVMLVSMLTTSGDPSTTYNFNVSITALCICILGGLGSIEGVLVGAAVLMGFDTIVMAKLAEALQKAGAESGGNVYLQPTNWKWLLFGLALVLMMRFRREGLLPSERTRAELTKDQGDPEVSRTGVE